MIGHHHRFGYSVRNRHGEFFAHEVGRTDLNSGKTEAYDFGKGRYCMEAIFAPEPGTAPNLDSGSEPGWLLTQVYDSHTRKGFLAILDSEHLADGPLALVHNEHHLPLSFHGWWHAA